MAEIYLPYTTLEEKQGIKDANTDKTLLRDEMLVNKKFLVYDDGIVPPFTIPDEVIKHGFLVMLEYLNEIGSDLPIPWTKTPAEFLADVKARL